MSTSKSAPGLPFFNDFDFQIAFARRRGANFVDILGNRSLATPVFRTYLCELSKRQNYGKTQHFAQFLPAKTSLLSNIDAARATGNFQYSRKLELLNFLWLMYVFIFQYWIQYSIFICSKINVWPGIELLLGGSFWQVPKLSEHSLLQNATGRWGSGLMAIGGEHALKSEIGLWYPFVILSNRSNPVLSGLQFHPLPQGHQYHRHECFAGRVQHLQWFENQQFVQRILRWDLCLGQPDQQQASLSANHWDYGGEISKWEKQWLQT